MHRNDVGKLLCSHGFHLTFGPFQERKQYIKPRFLLCHSLVGRKCVQNDFCCLSVVIDCPLVSVKYLFWTGTLQIWHNIYSLARESILVEIMGQKLTCTFFTENLKIAYMIPLCWISYFPDVPWWVSLFFSSTATLLHVVTSFWIKRLVPAETTVPSSENKQLWRVDEWLMVYVS